MSPLWLLAQDFKRVYETLRDELVADPLTEGQPQFAADHLKRVYGACTGAAP